MADNSNNENGLPPKLDLRKKVFTPLTATRAFPASAPSTAGTNRLESPSMPSPLMSDTTATTGDGSKGTVRIKLSAAPEPAAMPTLMNPSADIQDGAATATVSVEAAPAADSTPSASGPRPLTRPVMAPKTIKLKKPVPLGIKRDTPDPAAPFGSKRATSKISLPSDQDGPMTSTPISLQPIRIAQTTPIQAVTTQAAADASGNENIAPVLAPPPPQPAPDPKRQTSRISLESVLGNEGETGPKTIKLKRPGISTVKVQGLEPSEVDEPRNKTAMIVLPIEHAGEDTPDTQKKTIKVKRPSARPSLRTSASGEAGGGSSPTLFAPPSKSLVPDDSAHWTFILAGCAATLITGVLIYVFCAQTFGPNLSLTPLSYSGGGSTTELPWPGRIYRVPR